MVTSKKQPKTVVSPAVEGDVPVLVDSEKHGGGGEGGEAGKLPLTHHSHPEPLVMRVRGEGEGEG